MSSPSCRDSFCTSFRLLFFAATFWASTQLAPLTHLGNKLPFAPFLASGCCTELAQFACGFVFVWHESDTNLSLGYLQENFVEKFYLLARKRKAPMGLLLRL